MKRAYMVLKKYFLRTTLNHLAPSGSKWCKYFSTSRHIQPQNMWHQVRVFLTSGVFPQYFVTIFSIRKMKILICFVLKILRNIKQKYFQRISKQIKRRLAKEPI